MASVSSRISTRSQGIRQEMAREASLRTRWSVACGDTGAVTRETVAPAIELIGEVAAKGGLALVAERLADLRTGVPFVHGYRFPALNFSFTWSESGCCWYVPGGTRLNTAELLSLLRAKIWGAPASIFK